MTIRPALALLLLSAPLASQALPRADLPRAGSLRVTFDPVITFWDEEFHDGARRPLGWFLTDNWTRADMMPQLARLEADIAVAAGTAGYSVILGTTRLSLRAERRVTPLLLEMGVSDRLSLGVRVPLVRVQMRAGLALDSTDTNLGRNPRGLLPNGDSTYGAFFTQFDAALAQMQQNIAGGTYGPPGSGTRAAAQAFADSAGAVRGALYRAAYGLGPGDAAPFLPTANSSAGVAIDLNVARIQQRFAAAFGVPGFTDEYLLPAQRASATDVNAMLVSATAGFGAAPFLGTRLGLRFWLGDVELQARYGLVRSAHYSATVGALLRLPTGHPESPHNFIDLPAGDHQMDIEGELTQEGIVGGRLWLNAAVRAGVQRPGERRRRVGPPDVVWIPQGATANLAWDPGDYVLLDVAPLYRFTPQFAVGLVAGYQTQSSDRYAYRTAQDSVAVATALGAPTPAAVLNGGTAERRTRVGGAVTFVGPVVEGSFSVERVISARGTAVPAATVLRIVLKTSRRLF